MDEFAKAIIDYHRDHGRKSLPWQRPREPYRVWVSEIMLQQTQVERVVDYFNRFIARFPSLAALADAPFDDVMSAWSGLGYYARARNLRKAAGLVVERHNGELPDDLPSLLALPGIGRSTAGAIRSSAFGIPTPILDGNVRRVLSRFHGVRGIVGKSTTEKTLWKLAERHTPAEQIAAYTQGIMDFGAELCRKVQPRCAECPLADTCVALARGMVDEIPVRAKRAAKPLRRAYFLLITDCGGRIYVERRPQRGIWGGLWCFPMRSFEEGIEEFAGSAAGETSTLPAPAIFTHHFTHFDLEIHPVRLVIDPYLRPQDDSARWVFPDECDALGMPAPTKRLTEEVFATTRQNAQSDQADAGGRA